MSLIPIDEAVHFDVATHRVDTGAVSDADSAPTFDVFEEATDTPILDDQSMTKRTSLTGNYRGTFTASAANGFEAGKWYNVVVTATVNSVTAKCVAKNFRVAPAENVAGVPKVDTTHISGTAQTANDVGADVNEILTDTGTTLDGKIDTIDTNVDSILADTGTDGVVLANDAITSAKIAANAIGSSEIADGAITAAKIATGAIDADAIAADAVTEIQSGLSTLTAAQVNAEVDTAIADARLDELLAADSDIDGAAPPTVGSVFHELLSKTTGSFTFDQTTDSLEAIRDKQTDIETDTQDLQSKIGTPSDLGGGATVAANLSDIEAQTDDIGGAGAGLTAVPWNAAWDAEVQSEVQDAIEANHLDHLLAVTYDPASKPGAADALLNELVESDAGVSRYTANALEQAPTGGSAPTASEIADAVWEEALADHEGTVGSTAEALADAGGSGASAADIADAVWDEARSGHVSAGSFGEGVASVQGNVTGNVAGSVGSVTGNVGGNVAGSVGSVAAGGITASSIADNAIDAGAIAADAITSDKVAPGALAKGDQITGFNDLSAAQVNAEADTALSDYGALKPTVAGRTLDVNAGGEAGLDLDNTSGTLAKGTDLTGFNDLDAAGVRSAVGLASANLDTQIGDLPTNAELATALAAADDAVLAAIAALNNLSAAQVNAEVVDALATDTYVEPSAPPAATASLKDKIAWLAVLARNKVTQTATTQTLRNDADSGNIATASVSDDGTTFTRAEWA